VKARFFNEIASVTNVEDILAAKKELERLITLLESVKKQELNYNWKTDKFKPADMGIIRFTPERNPKTMLTVGVKNVIHFDAMKFPPVIERIESRSENVLSNFSITFLNSITIGFTSVTFSSGIGSPTKFDVKIRDVHLKGPLLSYKN
jgi:hypothetical protein